MNNSNKPDGMRVNKMAGYREPYVGMPVCLDGCLNINFNDNHGSSGGHNGNMGSGGNHDNVNPGTGNAGNNSIAACVNNLPLAMAYVPMQRWEGIYEIENGFRAGTIFQALDLPFVGGGAR